MFFFIISHADDVQNNVTSTRTRLAEVYVSANGVPIKQRNGYLQMKNQTKASGIGPSYTFEINDSGDIDLEGWAKQFLASCERTDPTRCDSEPMSIMTSNKQWRSASTLYGSVMARIHCQPCSVFFPCGKGYRWPGFFVK